MDDEDDDLYNTSSRSKRQETKEPARVTDAQSNGNQSSLPAIVKEETLEDQDQDSDSDIEFVITPKAGQRVEAPTRAAPYTGVRLAKDEQSAAPSLKISGSEPSTAAIPLAAPININPQPELNGKPQFQVNLEEDYELKPWRAPGADPSDYFNYGFDEFTWAAYCDKQSNLKEEYTAEKVMQRMTGNMDMMSMMSMMGMGMMGMTPEMMMGGFNPGQQQPQSQPQQQSFNQFPGQIPGGGQSMPMPGMMPPGMPGMMPPGILPSMPPQNAPPPHRNTPPGDRGKAPIAPRAGSKRLN